MRTIVIPFKESWFSGAHNRFKDLLNSFVVFKDDSIRFKLIDPQEINSINYDAVFIFRCYFLKSVDIKTLNCPIFLYHDDFHHFLYGRIFSSKELEKIISNVAIYFSVSSHYFNRNLFTKFAYKSYWVPWGIPNNYLENTCFNDWNKREDVIFISGFESRVYPLRKVIYSYSRRNSGSIIRPLKHPSYSTNEGILGDKYYNLLRGVKGAISTTGRAPIDVTVMKYFEIPACGCVPFFEDNPELKYLGFIDGVNCVIINQKNFRQKTVVLKSPMALEIAQNAFNLIKMRHTIDIRIRFIADKISEFLK